MRWLRDLLRHPLVLRHRFWAPRATARASLPPTARPRWLFWAACLVTTLACSSGSDPSAVGDGGVDALPIPHPSAKSIPVYDDSSIIDYAVTFPPGEWDKLLTLTGDASIRWVKCSFTFQGETFASAACRRKGNEGLWPNEKKPQFVVRFNLTDPNGRFRGLRRINLESYYDLAAPIRDRLAMWLMREAGIDAPRVNHVRVTKDGQPLGLYMNIEVLDKEFLEDHFPTQSDGNLWEEGVQLDTNEAINDQTRLAALQALVDAEPDTGDHTAFFTQLATMMDMKQVLREMAGETALLADDNFSNGSRNFYYYEHPTRKFMVLPWDFDTVITESPPDADPFGYYPTRPPLRLRQLINQNPSWKAEFVDDLVDIRDNVLARMPAQVDLICAQISDAVAADPNRTHTFEEFQTDCMTVKDGIAARIAALKTLLGR